MHKYYDLIFIHIGHNAWMDAGGNDNYVMTLIPTSVWPRNLHLWLFLTPCTFQYQIFQFLPNTTTFNYMLRYKWYLKSCIIVCFVERGAKYFAKIFRHNYFLVKSLITKSRPWGKGQLHTRSAQAVLLLPQSADWPVQHDGIRVGYQLFPGRY